MMEKQFDAPTQSQQKGFALSRTFGTSMRPLIWGGCHCVAVVPLDTAPKVGDILMFRQVQPDGSRKNIVHRVVEIRRDGAEPLFITRGDNCLVTETVHSSEIIGRVAEVHRVSGYRPWFILPGKRFAVTDAAYLRYVKFWTAIWPLRRCCYLMRAHARGLRVRLLSLFKKR